MERIDHRLNEAIKIVEGVIYDVRGAYNPYGYMEGQLLVVQTIMEFLETDSMRIYERSRYQEVQGKR